MRDARLLEQVRNATQDTLVLSRRKRIGIAFFGTWMTVGLYLDGWAHHNDKPETFFTPWHGVLYSGFLGAVLFWAWESHRERQSIIRAIAIERLAVLGLALFFVGAISDAGWHELFGVEVGVEALLSPTHLLLMIGGLLMITAPIRAAWQESEGAPSSFRGFLPTLVPFVLATALVSFFLMYLSAFEPATQPAVRGTPAGDSGPLTFSAQERHAVVAIASILITNVLLVAPVLLIIRRWVPPKGSFTLLFVAVPFGMIAVHSFTHFPLVLPALVAGLVADALAPRIATPAHASRDLRAFALLVPFVLWSTWFALYKLLYGLAWTPELWLGTITLASLSGFGLSLLVFPPREGDHQAPLQT